MDDKILKEKLEKLEPLINTYISVRLHFRELDGKELAEAIKNYILEEK